MAERTSLFRLGGDVVAPSRPGDDIVAYGPRDAALLKASGWAVVDLIERFGDTAQRTVLEEGLHIAEAVESAVVRNDIPLDAARLLGIQCFMQLAAWRRFEAAVSGADVIDMIGGAPAALDREAAFEAFIPHPIQKPHDCPAYIQRLLAWANERVLARSKSKGPTLMVGVAGGFPVPLTPRLERDVAKLRLKTLPNSDWVQVGKLVSDAAMGLRPRLGLVLAADPTVEKTVQSVLASDVFQSMPRPVRDRTGAWLRHFLCADRQFKSLFDGLDASHLRMAFQGVLPPARVAMATRLRAAGARIANFTHGSVVSHGDDTARRVLDMVGRAGWVSSPSTSDVFARAPLLLPREKGGANHHPARYRDPEDRPPPSERGTAFRILHAGNYISWANIPWVVPNEFEYYQALKDMVEVVTKMSGVEISVRIKTTNGLLTPDGGREQRSKTVILDPDTFFDEVGALSGMSRSTEPSIVEAILESDLVVSDGWTSVIHDALELGRPVLMHTLTGRFAHMPARERPPVQGARAAVYACASGQALANMLEGIVAHHAGARLTAEELAPYRWPQDAPTASEALERVVLD